MWFAREQCEVVVLEAGIGGRQDSTNIVKDTLAAVICSIGLDHVEVLGDTPAKIAAEKCGVLRPGSPASATLTRIWRRWQSSWKRQRNRTAG